VLPVQVDVVGVDGELKDIAMRALNTRANFAYSQKEVGGWAGRAAVLCVCGVPLLGPAPRSNACHSLAVSC
jgi:hypothetical protein